MRWIQLVFLSIALAPAAVAQPLELTWATGIGSTGTDQGKSLAVDPSDSSSIVVGEFAGTVDFDRGPGVLQLTALGSGGVFVAKYDADGDPVWVRQIDGGNFEDVSDVALDAAGNVYLCGRFTGSPDFDPGAGVFNLSANGFSSDAYLLQLDSDGDFVRAVRWGNTQLDYAQTLAVAGDGSVYVSGIFTQTVDFDPGAGTANLTATTSSFDIYLLKLDAAWDYVWAVRFGSSFVENAGQLAVDASGAPVLMGTFQGNVDFDPGAGSTVLTGFGDSDVFVVKLAADSTFEFARRIGGQSTVIGAGLSLDAAGGMYFGGYFAFTIDADPGPGTANLTSNGSGDAFLIRLDANGDYVWGRSVGDTGLEEAFSSALAPNGNVYLAGRFEDTVDFDPGAGVDERTSGGAQPDGYVWELNALTGDYVETYVFEGDGNFVATGLVPDPAGDLRLAGTLSGSHDFDPGAGFLSIGTFGGLDGFLARLGSAGDPPPDVEEVELATLAARDVALPGQTVHVFVASILGDVNLTDATVTPPGGSPISLTFDPVEGAFVHVSAFYDTLAELRADYPLGDYRLDFNGGTLFTEIGFEQTQPTCFAQIDEPLGSCIGGVSTTPTFAWTYPAGCSSDAVDVGLDVAATEFPLFELSFFPPSSGSWDYPAGAIVPAPVDPPGPQSPLMAGESYVFGVDTVRGFTMIETLGPDTFEYTAQARNDLDLGFTASAGGPVVTVGVDPGDVLTLGCAPAGSTGFDVVRGDLTTLRAAGFGSATDSCVANDAAGPSVVLNGTPAAGEGWWYLVRPVDGGGGGGSYSTGLPSEVAGRDAGIAASGVFCP